MITHTRQKTLSEQHAGTIDSRWIAGIALIALGVVLFLGQFFNAVYPEMLILPALAAIFLVWGITTRKPGLMIPAGIFTGISIGAWLVETDWLVKELSSDARDGIFLLAFAFGWACITPLTALYTAKVHWWPLIPAVIMALVGGALVIGGTTLQAAVWLGYVWPLVLVALGLYLLIRRATQQR